MISILGITLPLIIVLISSIIMWKSCEIFNQGSKLIGQNLPNGVRGATINAIGSSLPELITALLFFIILNESSDGISAALGTVIGSAVFNILIIPSIVISILIKKNHNLNIKKNLILRDGLILLFVQFFLFKALKDNIISLGESTTLFCLYIFYIALLFLQNRSTEKKPKLSKFEIIEGWKKIIIGGVIAAIGCWLCVHACEALSQKEWHLPFKLASGKSFPGLNISIGITALFVAAAASSLPDLFLSAIDAKQGHVDDALSNPLGSNIFDLCVAFTIPLIIYTIINGEINLKNTQNINELQYFIVLMIFITITFLASTLFWKINKFHFLHVLFFVFLFLMFVFFIFQSDSLNDILAFYL